MTDKKLGSAEAIELRRLAEEINHDKAAPPPDLKALSPDEVRHTLHELQVHQIELDMQNEELRRAQVELNTVRARYYNLFDQAPVGYCTLSEPGIILESNLTVVRMLDVTRSELINQPFSRFIFWEDQDTYYLSRSQIIKTGRTQDCDLRMVKKDGTTFWAHLTITTDQSEKSAPSPAYRIVLSDSTQRKQVEEALHDAHWRLESIIEGAHIGTWEWNVQTGETVFNTVGAEILGYAMDELATFNETMKLFSHPDDLAQNAAMLERHLSGELPYHECEHRVKHKEGGWVWVHDRGRVITRTADGEPLMMFGTRTDITARKAAEEKIQNLNARLEQLALTDYLTNLYNRRYFMQRGAEEFKRARRNRQPLALIMLDIDEFKKINDTYGHEAGDFALQQIAATLKSSLRETDVIGRLGGDEFAIILPATTLESANHLAERIQQMVMTMPSPVAGARHNTLTISVGVAVFTDEISGIDNLLRNADAAMYRAKNNGRNCVRNF
jgi:diguanylate cyclase (GGDEF)-like protein/PAS domain S-box-containing protein